MAKNEKSKKDIYKWENGNVPEFVTKKLSKEILKDEIIKKNKGVDNEKKSFYKLDNKENINGLTILYFSEMFEV